MQDLTKVDIRRAVGLEVGKQPPPSPFGDAPLSIRCTEHPDDAASLAVYPDHLVCYGCGFAIRRRMEALAYLLKTDVMSAIRQAGNFLRTEPVEQKELAPLSMSVVSAYESLLWGYRRERLTWLYARDLTEETIKRFRLGHDGTRFTLPVFDGSGKLVNIKYRTDPVYTVKADEDDKKKPPKYMGLYGRNDIRLYPEWLLTDQVADFLVVCEGEFDAVRLWQEGIPAISPTGGAGSLSKVPMLLAPYPRIRRLYIAADQDEPGERGAEELIAAAHDYETTRLYWPRVMGKDITELLEWQDTDYDYQLFRGLPQNRAA